MDTVQNNNYQNISQENFVNKTKKLRSWTRSKLYAGTQSQIIYTKLFFPHNTAL